MMALFILLVVLCGACAVAYSPLNGADVGVGLVAGEGKEKEEGRRKRLVARSGNGTNAKRITNFF